MWQPAGFLSQDNRNEMGIPVFWRSANSDPPWDFKIWFDQFLLAVMVKQNVNPDLLMEDPKPVKKHPVPQPETPRTGEDAQTVTDREKKIKWLYIEFCSKMKKEENEDLKLVTRCVKMKLKND